MDLSKLSIIFKFVILGIIYIIIFLVLRIIYKDIKGGGRKKVSRRTFGLEILESGDNSILKKGSIVPVNSELTIGRKNDNMLLLDDQFASGHHAKVYLKNTEYFIQDLNSTNGTYLNEERLEGKSLLKIGDEIKIGSALFKVIG